MGLTVILPSAFVAFPAGETDALPPRSRTRIISAGAFHNLVFFVLLSALAATHISDFVWPILGYRDVSAYGRVVVRVDDVGLLSLPASQPHADRSVDRMHVCSRPGSVQESPLYGHVPIGAVIYKVGDDALARTGAGDQWERVLGAGAGPVRGWCAAHAWFAGAWPPRCRIRRAPARRLVPRVPGC